MPTIDDFRAAMDAARPASKPTPLSYSELVALDLPATQWVHGSLIPFPGLIAISGRPGSQKTFFALWVALRASGGLPLFDGTDMGSLGKPEMGTKIPTLFIEEENTIRLIRERVKGFVKGDYADLYFYVDQGFKMTDSEWREAVIEFVTTKGIKLIVLDPFSSVMGLKDENSNAEVSQVMDLIRKEFIKRDVSVVFIHHPSKGAEDGKNLRGAGDILGKCDVHLSLEKEADGKTILVTYEKMRVADETEMANFRMKLTGDPLFGGLSFKYLGEAKSKAEEEHEAVEKSIMQTLLIAPSTQKAVADLIGSSRTGTKFQGVWERLVQGAKIYQDPDKKWHVK